MTDRLSERDDIGFLTLLLPLLERWKTVLAAVVLTMLLTAAISLLTPRRYEAAVSVSTLGSGKALPGDIGSLLGAANATGLQATPALVMLLSRQPGVVYRVAMRPFAPGSTQRIIDRIAALQGGSPISDREVVRSTESLLQGALDKETGVITLRAASRDSALARSLVRAWVDEVSATFVRATKTQGAEMRDALQARVDSGQRQLHRAEEEYRSFLAHNRTVGQFSEASLEQQRLMRAMELAQSVYDQAVKEREAAISKELEETPAMVVLDAPARTLMPVPRQTGIKMLVVGLFTGFAVWALLLVRDALTRDREQRDNRARLWAALATMPAFGRLLIRFFDLDERTVDRADTRAAERSVRARA